MSTSKTDFVDLSHVKKSITIVQILEHYGLTSKLRQNGDIRNRKLTTSL